MKAFTIPLFGVLLLLASCEKQPAPVVEAVLVNEQKVYYNGSKTPWPPASGQQVADVLRENYLVVMDDSGSMKGERIRQAKRSLARLAESLPVKHNLGLMFLNRKVVLPLDRNDRTAFLKEVERSRADGGTPLTHATQRAYAEITKQASKQSGYGAFHIIIITDGQSGDGSPMATVRAIVQGTPVQVHVIGFHLSEHEMNDPLFVDYQTASNSEELTRAFEAVAAETSEFSDPREFSQ